MARSAVAPRSNRAQYVQPVRTCRGRPRPS